jgi:hypothetical protein
MASFPNNLLAPYNVGRWGGGSVRGSKPNITTPARPQLAMFRIVRKDKGLAEATHFRRHRARFVVDNDRVSAGPYDQRRGRLLGVCKRLPQGHHFGRGERQDLAPELTNGAPIWISPACQLSLIARPTKDRCPPQSRTVSGITCGMTQISIWVGKLTSTETTQ